MSNKKKKKIFILKAQLTSAIFLLVVALISGFFIFGPKLTEMAMALSGNYSKSSAEQLTAGEWNNLANDFLDKEGAAGDSMAGPLTLSADPTANMQAATKQYVDSKLSVGGGGARIFCGSTVPGATAWEQYKNESIRVLKVDTSAAGFTSTPHYFTNLSGAYSYASTGGSTMYHAEADGFRFYALFVGEQLDFLTPAGSKITPTQANTWNWTVHWCGVGN